MKAWAGPLTTPELLKASEERLNSVIFRTDMFTKAPTDSRRFGLPEHMKKRIIRIIVTSSAIDKMFEIFGPRGKLGETIGIEKHCSGEKATSDFSRYSGRNL